MLSRYIDVILGDVNLLEPNLNQDLRLKILDAPYIIRGFVKGETKSNYELYLTEMLNNSDWMRNRFEEEFKWQEKQSCGECDAYSGDYGIDFKLIASKTALQSKNLFSPSVTKINDGVTAYGLSKQQGSLNATRLFAALRGISLDKLRQIRLSRIKKQGIENDIKTFLGTLETEKNVLLFFPYMFSFENKEYKNGNEIVVDALQYDFGQALIYRSINASMYNTLFTTIYKDDFLLMNVEDSKLVLVDTIPVSKCETFEHLKDYSDIWR